MKIRSPPPLLLRRAISPLCGVVRRSGEGHSHGATESRTSLSVTSALLQNDYMTSVPRSLGLSLLLTLSAVLHPVFSQSPPSVQHTERPTPPTRSPNSPGYVAAKELPDGSNPPANTDGNFIVGPTHDIPLQTSPHDAILRGTVTQL